MNLLRGPRPPSTVAVAASLAALVLAVGAPVVARAADGPPWSWPLGSRAVGADFDLPDGPYRAGHRGVDLPGRAGEPVRAVAPGRVVFSGVVAGVGVVSVDHGAERSTYQPVVRRVVRKGDAVDGGEVLGRLDAAGSHCVGPCLHLGRLEGERYLDPRERLTGASRFVLVDPEGPLPRPASTALGGGGGPVGDLARPVGGPVTSAFGMRVHPVTGVRKLHDGVDLGAPCGTPVRAARAGTVRSAGHDGAYGIRVVVDHGRGVETGYAHLTGASVSPGDRVTTSSTLGTVGSTGLSTGCHLHFMVVRGGVAVDPMG
jgi:murein DD-endopeptidase MepM/ murein hydrolase activator NlpD